MYPSSTSRLQANQAYRQHTQARSHPIDPVWSNEWALNFASKWRGSTMRIISSNWVDHLFRNHRLSAERKHRRLRARVGESVWLNDVNRSNKKIMCLYAKPANERTSAHLSEKSILFITLAAPHSTWRIELLMLLLSRSRVTSLAIWDDFLPACFRSRKCFALWMRQKVSTIHSTMCMSARACAHKNRTYGNPVEPIFCFLRHSLHWNMINTQIRRRRISATTPNQTKQDQVRH